MTMKTGKAKGVWHSGDLHQFDYMSELTKPKDSSLHPTVKRNETKIYF